MLIKLKVLKTSNKCPTLGVKPGECKKTSNKCPTLGVEPGECKKNEIIGKTFLFLRNIQ